MLTNDNTIVRDMANFGIVITEEKGEKIRIGVEPTIALEHIEIRDVMDESVILTHNMTLKLEDPSFFDKLNLWQKTLSGEIKIHKMEDKSFGTVDCTRVTFSYKE